MSVRSRIGAALSAWRSPPAPAAPSVQRDYGFQDWISLYQNAWQQPQSGMWPGFQTTYGKDPAEPIGDDFAAFVSRGLQSNGVIFSLEQKRIQIFSQVRYQFQGFNNGRPGKLFPKPNLSLLERPWRGGTTSDLNARMLIDADLAGNNFLVAHEDEVVRLRPDWVEIVLKRRMLPLGPDGEDVRVGFQQVGIMYYEGGIYSGATPAVFVPGEYSHFAPMPDPLATYRGMSWLTPVIREIQADTQATKHKLKFFENAATVNLAVSMPKELTPTQFKEFVEVMDARHKGVEHAYETLYAGGGADVTPIGATMQQIDFKATQGAGETRLASAAGLHPVIVGLSEGMQGSSLNSGNYNAAKRSTVDTTFRHLWQNAAGSLEQLVTPPNDISRLWYDARDVPFLHEDQKDAADIQQLKATTITMYVREGFTPESAIAAVDADDRTLLVHTGLVSVQLQPPGQVQPQAGGAGPKEAAARSGTVQRKFNPGQRRDPDGKWGDGIAGAALKTLTDAFGAVVESARWGHKNGQTDSGVLTMHANGSAVLSVDDLDSSDVSPVIDSSQLPSSDDWRGLASGLREASDVAEKGDEVNLEFDRYSLSAYDGTVGLSSGDESASLAPGDARRLADQADAVADRMDKPTPVGGTDLSVAVSDQGTVRISRGAGSGRTVPVELSEDDAGNLADYLEGIAADPDSPAGEPYTDDSAGYTLTETGNGGARLDWPDGSSDTLTAEQAMELAGLLRGPGEED